MEFKETIHAPKERVWDTLWNDATYQQWTAVFSEGSKVITDWNKGSRVLFLNGKNDGMLSMVADVKPNEYISFRHLGMVKNGVEDTDSVASKEWAGAMENYSLKSVDGGTELTIELEPGEANQHSLSYFLATFPKALGKLKELSERG